MNDIAFGRPTPWTSVIALFSVNCIYQPAAVAILYFAGIIWECLEGRLRSLGRSCCRCGRIGSDSGAGMEGAFVVCRDWAGSEGTPDGTDQPGLTSPLPFILLGLVMC